MQIDALPPPLDGDGLTFFLPPPRQTPIGPFFQAARPPIGSERHERLFPLASFGLFWCGLGGAQAAFAHWWKKRRDANRPSPPRNHSNSPSRAERLDKEPVCLNYYPFLLVEIGEKEAGDWK